VLGRLTVPEVKEKEGFNNEEYLKAVHGYEVRYHRFHNEQQNSDVLMVWTYYKGKLIECIAYGNGERLSI